MPLQTFLIQVTHQLDKNNIIVLGDLNADGTYYLGGFPAHPADFAYPNWNQTITEIDTTNFGANSAAYDRIILSKAMVNSYVNYNIVSNTTSVSSFNPSMYPANESFNRVYVDNDESKKMLSDHQTVWAEFNFGSIESQDDGGNRKNEFLKTDTVHAKGTGLVSNKDVTLFVVGAYFAFMNGYDHVLNDVRSGGSTNIQTDGNGDIPN